jgi:hypothetical protein
MNHHGLKRATTWIMGALATISLFGTTACGPDNPPNTTRTNTTTDGPNATTGGPNGTTGTGTGTTGTTGGPA